MLGTWGWYVVPLAICFSKNGTDWWMLTDLSFALWSELKAGPDYGRLWNKLIWEVHTDTVPTWPPITGYAGQVFRGPWGPPVVAFDDSFTV